MARVKLDITIPDRSKFDRALDEARTEGLEVSRSFIDLGMISGSIEARSIDRLVRIDGIASVTPKRGRADPGASVSARVVPFRRP